MKRLYKYVGALLCFSLVACSTDNDLEAPLFGEAGNVPEGTVSLNPYWSWVTEFPGFVNVNEPRVEATVTVKGATSAEDTYWRSTGLYVVPGDTAIVTVNGVGAEVYYRIGGFTDALSNSATDLKRYYDMDFHGKLEAGENKIMSYFGGHLYVYFAGANGDVQLQVKGAVASPDYVAGVTNASDWKNLLEKTSVPYGELRSENIILTLPLSDLKKISDPQAVITFYDEFIKQDCDGLYGGRAVNAPIRLRTDLQLTASSFNSNFGGSYPVVALEAFDSAYVALPALSSSNDYVVAQSFTLPYTLDNLVPEFYRQGFYGLNYYRLCDRHNVVPSHSIKGIVNSFANSNDPSRRYTDLASANRSALFVQLAQEFGWNIFPYITAEMKKDMGGTDEKQNQLDAMAIYAAEYANANLAGYFEAWGVVLSGYAINYMSQYPSVGNFWENYTEKAGSFEGKTAVVKNRGNWPVYADADRADWTAESKVSSAGVEKDNVHVEGDGKTVGPLTLMFDGKASTLWHSVWNAEGARYPHTITIDMQKEQTFNYVYFVQRSTTNNNNKTRRFQLFVKENGEWVDVDGGKIFYLHTTTDKQRVYLSKDYTASELKLVLRSPHPKSGEDFSDKEPQMCNVSIAEFGVGEWK